MDIEKIDENLKSNAVQDEIDGDVYAIPCEPFRLYGITYSEEERRFIRFPQTFAESVSSALIRIAQMTAGGRLRFSSDTEFVEIGVTYSKPSQTAHMTLIGQSGFMLLEETENGISPYVRPLAPSFHHEHGFTARVAADGKLHDYILYFPLYCDVKTLTLKFSKGATVAAGKRYRREKPVLYYGSSITQGGCASRPDNSYQALISKWNNIDFINFGLSGNARGEEAIAEYLSKIACSAFVCDYDHNAPNAAHLEKTHYRLYEIFRRRQPDTPILFVSKPDFDGDPEAGARKAVIKKTYLTAKKTGDGNVYFLDGKKLLGKADRENCLIDGRHPTDLGFYRMAKAIYKELVRIDGKFA